MSFGGQELNPSEEEERQSRIIEELKRIYTDAYLAGALKAQEKMLAKSNELTERYGKAALERCTLYHLLIGSGMKEGQEAVFDIGDGEIEKFIREELSRT